jgi:hypothetical protein
MLNGLILVSMLAGAAQAGGGVEESSYTSEQLAVGAVRELISAQAVHRQMFPGVGYACRLDPLVEAEILLDVWLAGRRVDGYTFDLWCDTKDAPQTTFRASAVPVKRGTGAALTVCTDETNVVRTIDGDVAACFEKGQGTKN